MNVFVLQQCKLFDRKKVSRCVEIVLEHGKMVRGEGLPVLDKRMETMDPDKNEILNY